MRHRGHRFPGQPGAGQQQSALRAPARERQAGFGDEQARQRPSAGADPAAPFSIDRPQAGFFSSSAAMGRSLRSDGIGRGMGRDGAAANSSSRVSRYAPGRRPAARRRARRRCAGSARAAGLTSSTQGCAGRRIDVRIEEQAAKRVAARNRHAVRTAAGSQAACNGASSPTRSARNSHAALRLEQQLSAPVAVPAEACARRPRPARPPGRRPGRDRSRHRRRKSALSDSLCF